MSIVNYSFPPSTDYLIAQKKGGSLHRSYIFNIEDRYVVKVSWPMKEEALSLLVDEPILMQRMPSYYTPTVHWWGLRYVLGELAVVVVMDYIKGETLAKIFNSCKDSSCLNSFAPDLISIRESLVRFGIDLR